MAWIRLTEQRSTKDGETIVNTNHILPLAPNQHGGCSVYMAAENGTSVYSFTARESMSEVYDKILAKESSDS